MTWETTSFTVQQDQKTDENYRKSDLMYAYTTDVNPTDPIPLEFNHCMSKITIKVTDPSEAYDVDYFKSHLSAVYMKNINREATISRSNDKLVATGTGDLNNIQVCGSESAEALCSTGVSCIIPPQTVSGGEGMISIYVDDSFCYKYSVPTGGIQFKGGYEYIYKLTLKKEGFSLSEITIKSWEPGTENPIEGEAR